MKAYGLAKMAQSARDAAQKQMGTAQQGLQQGAKQSAELASVPKTTVNVLNTPYGQAYSTPGTQANENKAVDIVKTNKNKPQTT